MGALNQVKVGKARAAEARAAAAGTPVLPAVQAILDLFRNGPRLSDVAAARRAAEAAAAPPASSSSTSSSDSDPMEV